MQYVVGAFVFIYGIVLLALGGQPLQHWMGYASLGGSSLMFMPQFWRLRTPDTPKLLGRILDAPYLGVGGGFYLLGVGTLLWMGGPVRAGEALSGVWMALFSLLMLAAGSALTMPLLRERVRQLAMNGPVRLGFNLFEVAAARRGRLTAAELAADFGATYEDCRDALESIVEMEAAEKLVSANGAVIYRFPELEGDQAKIDLLE